MALCVVPPRRACEACGHQGDSAAICAVPSGHGPDALCHQEETTALCAAPPGRASKARLHQGVWEPELAATSAPGLWRSALQEGRRRWWRSSHSQRTSLGGLQCLPHWLQYINV
jgi:hypothetical protein